MDKTKWNAMKILKVAVAAFMALCLIGAGVLIAYEVDSRRVPGLVQETQMQVGSHIGEGVLSDDLEIVDSSASAGNADTAQLIEAYDSDDVGIQITNETEYAEAVSQNTTASSSSSGNNSSRSESMPEKNTLTVRRKTFELKSGVDEKTLEKNIGWMESSSAPGEAGVCVVMGHRNTQFRILKDVALSDVICVVDAGGNAYDYTVTGGEILEDGAELLFPATEEKLLMLITCYPFYYSGHAPHKYVVTAVCG